jgi:hypothetical protein
MRLPFNFTTASDGRAAGQMNNNAMGVLMPDNETLVQVRSLQSSPLSKKTVLSHARDGVSVSE